MLRNSIIALCFLSLVACRTPHVADPTIEDLPPPAEIMKPAEHLKIIPLEQGKPNDNGRK